MPEPQISLRDGGRLRVDQDTSELDPMAKTALKLLLNPKGKDQHTAVKGHLAKHNEPEVGDNNDYRDNMLILKHTKMTTIREHIEAGRKVIVHLYSDGINSVLRDIIAGTVAPCPLQHPPHKFNVTLQDVVTGRTHEFRQSLRHLGVRDENVFETGWSDIEPVKDYPTFQKKLKDLIIGYEKKHPGASHKCISGEYDRDGLGRNPTHRACWDVARELIDEHPTGYPSSNQLWDFRFYRTYTYYQSPEHREAQYIWALPQYLKYKQRALDQYKKWKPSHGELAWGYHSVKALIDASYNDPYVYVDMLDNDPTNPENPSHVLSPDTILVQIPEDKSQLLDRLPHLEAIRLQEDLENEEAEKVLERFEQAMRGPEGQGYKLTAVTLPLKSGQ
ncbi:hypothetical protein BGZ82_005481 [Podila clonocystis]|nr:hypothetical protein BGZ82_005481 [Podila clonocystis]